MSNGLLYNFDKAVTKMNKLKEMRLAANMKQSDLGALMTKRPGVQISALRPHKNAEAARLPAFLLSLIDPRRVNNYPQDYPLTKNRGPCSGPRFSFYSLFSGSSSGG